MHTIIKYFKTHNGPLPSYNALHPFHMLYFPGYLINNLLYIYSYILMQNQKIV
jgi:hypothetical protein